eukprot:COSAG05_NODE_23337_length_258_cov_1.924528_1_plen_57_part_01
MHEAGGDTVKKVWHSTNGAYGTDFQVKWPSQIFRILHRQTEQTFKVQMIDLRDQQHR